MGYLNRIKRYLGKIFMKFERDEGSFIISFSLHFIKIFTRFSSDSYYEPHGLSWNESLRNKLSIGIKYLEKFTCYEEM